MELTAAEWVVLGKLSRPTAGACEAWGSTVAPARGIRLQQAVEESWTHLVGLVVPAVDEHPHNRVRDRQATDAADALLLHWVTRQRLSPAEALARCVSQAVEGTDRTALLPRLRGFLRAYELIAGRSDRSPRAVGLQFSGSGRTSARCSAPG